MAYQFQPVLPFPVGDKGRNIIFCGGVGRVFHSGKQAINARMAYYYNVEKPRFGAQWDFQLTFTLMYPKKIGNG